MYVPEGLFAVWDKPGRSACGKRPAEGRQMRKKQLKREPAKETRFRPAGQAPIEQGFDCQSNSKAYSAVSLTRPAVVLAHESFGACPLQMSRMLSSLRNMRRVELHQILIASARVEFSTMDGITFQSGSETPSPRNPEGSVKRFGSLTHSRIPAGVCVSHCSLL